MLEVVDDDAIDDDAMHSNRVKVLKGLYFTNDSFWSVSDNKKGSWIWKSLFAGRKVLKENCS